MGAKEGVVRQAGELSRGQIVAMFVLCPQEFFLFSFFPVGIEECMQ